MAVEVEAEAEAEIDRLPIDLLAHIFVLITSFTDLAQVSRVCKKWKVGVKQSFARRENLSFAGWKMDDDSTARLVGHAYSLKELEMPHGIYDPKLWYNPNLSSTGTWTTVWPMGLPALIVTKDDATTLSPLLEKKINISRSRWGCQITDNGLYRMSLAKCVSNLTSISLWGWTGITDRGVVQLISRASSLKHLNIGGTFVTDESLYAIANSCPQLKNIVLWSCRHVTENGLLFLVNKCRKLESINVWGTRVPVDCFIALLTISPALRIKPEGLLLNVGNAAMMPIA